MNENFQEKQFSRRAFFGFISAGVIALSLWSFRRIDVVDQIQAHFGLGADVRPAIESHFKRLAQTDAALYQQSIWFFFFAALHVEQLLGRRIKRQVLTGWIRLLFEKRAISWPYVGYPDVGEYDVCNGLIRAEIA